MTADLERCVALTRRLIHTRSLPGEEGDIARLVQAEMEDLGYDDVRVDEAGNVLGRMAGRGAAPALAFNTHLDHVDVGDESAWPHPPFAAELIDDVVRGRGAVDIKGPLAAQVVGVAAAVARERPPGDVWVTCVVQEEIGGVGARHLAQHLELELVVVGEPSRNTIRRGHRGRQELHVVFFGRSAHASVPHEGVNPLPSLGRFLDALGGVEPLTHPDLGPSTLAPTLLVTDQTSANVIPSEARLALDFRNLPGQEGSELAYRLQEVAEACCDEGVRAEVTVPVIPRVAYTGMEMDIPADNPPYLLAADHPAVLAASGLLADELAGPRPVDIWRFATDGGHFAKAGKTPIGFGPGDELLAHTIDERISVADLDEAMRVNGRFALELAAAAG